MRAPRERATERESGEHPERREAGRHGRESVEGIWRLALPRGGGRAMDAAWAEGNAVGGERSQQDVTDTVGVEHG